MPDVSNLVEKNILETSDLESKYLNTADYNKFTSQTLHAQIKQKQLVDKSATSRFIKNIDLDKKVLLLATKA